MLPGESADDAVTWPADIAIDLEGRGPNLRGWLADADGRVEFVAGSTIGDHWVSGDWGFDLLRTMLPALVEKPAHKLNCLVARFDVAGGAAEGRRILYDTSMVTVVFCVDDPPSSSVTVAWMV